MKHLWRLLFLLLPFSLDAFHYGASEREHTGKVPDETPRRITPDAGPSVEGGINLFITGDFIYWTARMDGLAFAATGLGNNRSTVSRGRVYYPDWKWDAGFKVGIGHNLPHDGWDVSIEYTWLHSSATRSIKGDTIDPNWNVSDLEAFISPNLLSGVITRAQGNWHLHYNVVDLELGRNYFISHYLSLRPHIGMKGSWQDIDYRVRYQTQLTTQVPESNLRMKNDADFWGIGMRTGLNTTWHVDPIFSVYGNFAIAALWCQYEIKRRDTRSDSASPAPNPTPQLNTVTTVYDTEKDFHTLKGVLEFAIGIRGEWWFADDRYHFLVQAGWEEQLWINHNQFIKTHFVESAHGDMILQGFVLKMRFDF